MFVCFFNTSSYLLFVFTGAITEVEELGAIVSAVCTDNEAKMVKMRELLNESHPKIETYGCSAHYLNLLGNDVTVSSVVGHVNNINKYFRNHHIPNALLSQQVGSIKPVLPGATRWNSQIDCLKSYVTNRTYMLLICNNDENDISADITKLINDVNIYRNVKHHIDQLHPISAALDRAQSDHCSVADICDEWLNLIAHEDLAAIRPKIQKRAKQALTSAHFLAYMLHPSYSARSSKLSEDQRQLGRDLLSRRDMNLVPLPSQLKAQVAPFQQFMFTDTFLKQSPSTWYACVKAETDSDDLSKFCVLAASYLNMPASAACIERVFSSFSTVQSKIRNRLGVERAGKLVACYRSLRGMQSTDEW